MNERIEKLEILIPKLKANKKILPLKLECMEWELRALKAEKLFKESDSLPCVSERKWSVDEIIERLDSFKNIEAAPSWFNTYGR